MSDKKVKEMYKYFDLIIKKHSTMNLCFYVKSQITASYTLS